ncbi:helix-turn-helix domain-containing protein [Herbaspirillum seropedicae]|uniref:helix-turn-helix domain-containing protein n=1 Tax=Herbaspirillum seropedicae TaxID=964 RepID=UPI002859959E|nr:helix-turn-helix transcriptional regulator [Herbaspirillum seropedicae]MDR6398050.1 hypothetical protein [Herbaspirillum seropedicae]
MSSSTVPLTPLKAFRIANNLDSDQIVQQAEISRSYLTRIEQGNVPSPDIAARMVVVLNSGKCARVHKTHREDALQEAKQFLSAIPGWTGTLSEIHLLYPERYKAKLGGC